MIVKQLLKEKYILDIEPAEPWKIPRINYSLFTKQSRKQVKSCINHLVDYITHYYLLGEFPDEETKDDWVDEMEDKYGKEMKQEINKNPLKGNMIYGIKTLMIANFRENNYQDYIGENKQRFIKLTENAIQSCNLKKYTELESIDEKIDLVYNIKQNIYSLLKFLSC